CSSPGARWSPGSSCRRRRPPSRSPPGCSQGRSGWQSGPSGPPSSPRPPRSGSRCGRCDRPGRRPWRAGAGSPTPSSRSPSRYGRCTTASTSISSPPSLLPEYPREDLGHDEVQAVEVEPEEDRGQDHDDRRVVDLLLARPGDLSQLAPDLAEEGLELAELPLGPTERTREPGRRTAA